MAGIINYYTSCSLFWSDWIFFPIINEDELTVVTQFVFLIIVIKRCTVYFQYGFGIPHLNNMMAKRKIPEGPAEEPVPVPTPEIVPPFDPEDPLLPPEDPDFIPEELPDYMPPEELPPPGEAP